MTDRQQRTRQARLDSLNYLITVGINPYPASYSRSHTVHQALAENTGRVAVAGRIHSKRTHGLLSFIDIIDQTGNIQIIIKSDQVGKKTYQLVDHLDVGDFLGVVGQRMQSKTGQESILADEINILSKSLLPLPSQWYGLKDTETRFRKRYLDLLLNNKVRQVLDARWTILREMRRFFYQHDFVEVETPVLQPLYGGTNAKPFTTYMNALNQDFYLRIAPELYLKRLIVGGYDRVFEIARNFRNEGIDSTHQPEFTMIEWYEAYADYQQMMNTAEDMFITLAAQINHQPIITVGDQKIDISRKWPRVKFTDLLKKHLNIDWQNITNQSVKKLLKQHHLKIDGEYSKLKALFSLFDHLITPKLIGPIWVIDYPKDISPLAKTHRDDDQFVERFEAYIGGKEICDGWSEIISPLEQRKRFENEQKNMKSGDSEAHPLDQDFIESMEYGMPPLGGIGIGIDRLVMLITNTWSIREVIAFPTLRKKS